ncbi:UNVERIFIED_CONTAM: hypothetical protein Slati_1378900 [Sesamum latifolium]|uniref:DUF4283 domain-containing protein n=1 Tax=Sesamum latifolium TaxID=2727402 RepID=A0AAW2X2J9_9LAMI
MSQGTCAALHTGDSPPSDGGLLVEHHRWDRLSTTDNPLSLISVNNPSTVMVPFVFNPAEFPPLNSTESTRHPTQQMQKKSFSEPVCPNSKNQKSLKKFFLAGSNPTSIGTVNSINGRPTIIFSNAETQSLAEDFQFAPVGKFSHESPPYSQLHRLISNSSIKGAFTMSLINNKHALIYLTNESDFSRLWMRRIWSLKGFPMRIFKWSLTFIPEHESSIVPVWVNFSDLPAHLFRKDALFTIASFVGVDLQIHGRTFVQKVEYEQVPQYCSLCKHVGHHDLECYTKGNAQKSPRRRYVPISVSAPTTVKENANQVDVVDETEINPAETVSAPTTIDETEINNAENVVSIAENESFNGAVVGNFEHDIVENEVNVEHAFETLVEHDIVGALILRQDNFLSNLTKRTSWIKVDDTLRLFETFK